MPSARALPYRAITSNQQVHAVNIALASADGQTGCRETLQYQQLTSLRSEKGRANPALSHANSYAPNKCPLAYQGRVEENQQRSGISAESAVVLVHGPAPLHRRDAPLGEGKLKEGRERNIMVQSYYTSVHGMFCLEVGKLYILHC